MNPHVNQMETMTKTSLVIAVVAVISISLCNPDSVFAQESPDGWERLPDMPEVRSEMESVAIGEKIYVVGGLNNREQTTDTDESRYDGTRQRNDGRLWYGPDDDTGSRVTRAV